MNYWLRLYTGILHDPKVQRLTAEDFRGWINILCLAKEGGGLLPPIEDIAFGLRISTAEAVRLTEELVKRGLLDSDGQNMTPHNWHKRQFESDVSTERVKRFRNVSETPTETSPEQSRDRAETEQSREAAPASRAKPRSARTPVPCDDEFLDGLQKNPAYSMLNVRHCYQRMITWCQVNGRLPSRRRFINWLNREDKPMSANGSAPKNKAAYVGKNKPTVEEPMAEEMDECIDAAIRANDLVYLAKLRDEILKRGAVHDWERKVLTFFERPIPGDEPVTPAEMADLNNRIATLQPITRVG